MKSDTLLTRLVPLIFFATALTAVASPFTAVTPTVPGTLTGANFDLGGTGVSYSFPQPGGGSSTYRSDSGAANLKANNDAATTNAWVVGTLGTGSYLVYTVNVAAAGTYAVKARVASGTAGKFHLENDGTAVTGSVAVPVTGAWNAVTSWKTVDAGNVTLTAGTHKLKVVVDAQYFDLNTLTLAPVNAVPGTVTGANFDLGGTGVSYSFPQPGGGSSTYRPDSGAANLKANTDTATANAWVVGTLGTGSYLVYTVNVAAAGTYAVKARVASATAGTFHLENDGTAVTGSVAVPVTGAWNAVTSWKTVDAGNVTLTAGTHQLKVVVDAQYFDLNTLTLASVNGYTYGAAQPLWYTPAASTTVYLAPRTDGVAGAGTATNPYDASSAAKYDALVQRFKANADLYYAAGVYSTNGWTNATTTAGTNCRHLGAGIDQTIIRLASNAPGWCMFAVDYNQRADGFQMYNLTLDANGTQNALFKLHKTALTQVNLNGSNILFKSTKFMGFGTAIQGNECFPVYICPNAVFAGVTFSHVHVENCVFTQPATGNQDGCSICCLTLDPAWTAVDWAILNSQFIGVRGDFSYSHCFGATPLIQGNTITGANVGFYIEPGNMGPTKIETTAAVLDHNTFTDVDYCAVVTIHPDGQWTGPITFSNNTFNLSNAANANQLGLNFNGSFGLSPSLTTVNFIGNTFNGINQTPSSASLYRGIDLSGFGSNGPLVGTLTIQNNHFGSYVPSGREFILNSHGCPRVNASGNVYSNGATVPITYVTR